ncbi:uncharacterized protein [Eucyclogobius newberryi]|uniref:uncharacterized protein n=1 Tax=Eucyclogobius newberryi TaxID=166745 RepID=UPI003B5CA318
MPKTCVVLGCNTRASHSQELKFFQIPVKDVKKRELWLKALKRMNEDGSPWVPNSKHVYVCSRHFLRGKPHSEDDHPDYVPSIFPDSKAMTLRSIGQKLDRFNRKVQQNAKRMLDYQKSTTPTPKRPKSFTLPPPNVVTDDSLADPAGFLTPRQSGLIYGPAADNDIQEVVVGDEANCEVEASCLAGADQPVTRPTTSTHCRTEVTDRDSLLMEIDCLRSELRAAKTQRNAGLSTEIIKDNDKKSVFYTGVTWPVFLVVFDFCEPKLKLVANVSKMEQLFMTLVRLRQNIKVEYLADQVMISKTSYHKIFWNVLNVMDESLPSSAFRIETECVIGQLKHRFTLLKDILPVNLIKSSDESECRGLTGIDIIVRVCAALTELSTGIVKCEKK